MMNVQVLFYGIITVRICRQFYAKADELSLFPHHHPGLDRKIGISRHDPLTISSEPCNNCSALVRLLISLEWRSIIVIYDKSSDYLLHDVTKQLAYAHRGIVLELHEVNNYSDNRSFAAFLVDVHQRLFPRLDFLLVTSDTRVWDILLYINRVDSLSNRTTDFNHHSKWLVWLKSERIDKSVYKLDSLQNVALIKTVCNVEIYRNCTSIMTVVHHNQSTSLQHVPFTPCVNNSILFPALNYGYNRRKFIISTTTISAFILRKTVNNVTKYSGFCIYLLDALADSLNFTYEIIEPTDGTWGILVNGSWNGLVGQMERREADLALADITINVNRSNVMDFLLPPIYYDHTDIIYKEENHLPMTWLMLLRPFSPIVFLWIAVWTGGFFFVCSTAMILIRDLYGVENKPTTSEVFWFTVSTLLKQGIIKIPSSHGVRILVSAWLLFLLIIVAEYTAQLTAAFTVRPTIKPFENLRQLLDNTNYKLGIFPGSIVTMILKNSYNLEYREAWSKIVENSKTDPEVLNDNETRQVEKIKGGNYAFIRNDAAVRTYMRENCGLQRLGISLDWQPVSFGVPINSTIRLDFEKTMRQLETSGIFEYWWKLHQSHLKRPNCPSRLRSVQSSITLDDLKSGFVVLAAGVGAAVSLLAVEIVWNKFK